MTAWQDIQERHLTELTSDEFEQFCADLIQHEAYDRHDDPEFMGPTLGGKKDGGRDALLRVSKAPLQTKTDYQREYKLKPLSEDPIAGLTATRTAYSCKTGKNWLDLALRDVNHQTRAARAVEVLREGGYFKLLISQCAKLDESYKRNDAAQTPFEHLRLAFWDRLKRTDPNAEDPGPRIEILDASVLVRYLRRRHPTGAEFERWVARFDLDEVLHSLAQWQNAHTSDREQPRMVEDPVRVNIRNGILDWLHSSEDQSACIVGSPGVGKTRLILELLRFDHGIAPRVRVALSPQEAFDAINNERLFQRHADAILVVDDCLVDEVSWIVTRFRAATKRSDHARLFLLIPASPKSTIEAAKLDRVWRLEPLDDEHCSELIAKRLGRARSDDDVTALATFAEGFPWFAQLLADEFEQVTRAPSDMREALHWALASQREATSHELAPLRLRRARALLAATLAKTIDWTRIEPSAQDALARSVGLRDWNELFETADACERRGLLRRTLGWHFKYVTPQVLEREIVRWLLGPDGPDPGGRRLQHELPQQFGEGLVLALERLDATDAAVSRATEVAVEQLRNLPFAEVSKRGIFMPMLGFLLEQRPHDTIGALRDVIERADIEALCGPAGIPSRLIWALETFSTHPDGFDDSEAALFNLAKSELARGFLSTASIAWARLFLVELNMTHRPIDIRLHTLHRRLVDASLLGRRVALRGIEAVFDARSVRPAPTARDQQWPRPQPREAHAGRLRAWTWLMDRCDDPEATIRGPARQLAISLLRRAIRSGIGGEAMDLLEQQSAHFTDDERVKLRVVLEAISEHDGAFLDPEARQPSSLLRALEPSSFVERLRQRVSVWRPAAVRGRDDASRDDAVVREGLQPGVPLRHELQWLLTPEAKRAHVFAQAIGRGDLHTQLFDDLLALARSQPSSWCAQQLVAHYLGGIVQRGDRQLAELLVERLMSDPTLVNAAALTLIEIGANRERLRWLEQTLREDSIMPLVKNELGRRRDWLTDCSDADLLELLEVMADSNGGANAALAILLDRFDAAAMPLDLLERLLTEFEHQSAHDWRIGAKVLRERGGAPRVAALAVAILTGPPSDVHDLYNVAWDELHHAATDDPSGTFQVVARAFEQPETRAGLLTAFQFHAEPFDWPDAELLAWVGNDESRAIAAATMVRAHGERLPTALRGLIRRFGTHGPFANELARRLASPGGHLSDIAEHDQRQLERARSWLGDADPAIASFASRLVDKFERLLETYAAYQEGFRHTADDDFQFWSL